MTRTHFRSLCQIGGMALTISVLLLPVSPKKAYACEECTMWAEDVYNEMQKHEDWMVDEWWEQHVKPDMEALTATVRNAVAENAVTFGMAMDGQNLLNALRAIQESNVETMKNYAPSENVCKFGTLSRSLSLAENKARTTQLVMSEKSQDRQLGHKFFSSQGGTQTEFYARIKQFEETYCDPADFATAMSILCGDTDDTRQNNDINFAKTIESKGTLDVNFTDTSETEDENDVMALAANLYSHQVFDRINIDDLNKTKATESQSEYLNQRAIVAKRSVAENSFNVLVGQKSNGGEAAQPYFLEALKGLGLSDESAERYLGEQPSYDAQMEVLTKKIYQDPAFYANLMDSPANVNRQFAALQSFGLMQRRDIFETILRSEMLLSVILEMEISNYQTELQNRSNN